MVDPIGASTTSTPSHPATVLDDLAVVRRRYENDDGLRVPTRVMSYATPIGPIETDVDELV